MILLLFGGFGRQKTKPICSSIVLRKESQGQRTAFCVLLWSPYGLREGFYKTKPICAGLNWRNVLFER
jgi:hypothetical protein